MQGTNLIPRVATQVTTPPYVFNSNPYMNLFQGTDRYQAGVLSHYEFNEHAEVYGDFMFMNNRHETQVAPSGLFQATFQVNCNNPLLSAQQQTTLGCTPAQIAAGDQIGVVIGRRNVEGGPRQFGYEHTNYRGVLGVKGDINDAWSYDTYGSYYYTTLYNTNKNYVSLARGGLALNACMTGPGQVAAVTDSSCTPWNIWRDGGVTRGGQRVHLDVTASPTARRRRRSSPRAPRVTSVPTGSSCRPRATASPWRSVSSGAMTRSPTFPTPTWAAATCRAAAVPARPSTSRRA